MFRRSLLTAAAGLLAAPARGAAALLRVDVILDWLLNPNHAALYAAQKTGAFARAGLDVRLIAPSDPASPCPLLAAGRADLAIGYGSQINLVDAAGLGLVRIATLIDRPLNTVMASGRSGVRRLADLRGRRVGVGVPGVETAMLDAMLHAAGAGLGIADVTVVDVSYGMVAALAAGRLDAAIGAYRNNEVLAARTLGLAPVVFLPEEHGVPLYDELIVVAQRKRVGDPMLGQFVGAVRAGAAALRAQPEALWTAFAGDHPELATPLNRACWEATLPCVAAEPGRLDAGRYRGFEAFAVRQGIIRSGQALEEYAVAVG